MTKYQMCREMDAVHYRDLPWVVMMESFSKADLLVEYQKFLSINNK